MQQLVKNTSHVKLSYLECLKKFKNGGKVCGCAKGGTVKLPMMPTVTVGLTDPKDIAATAVTKTNKPKLQKKSIPTV